MLRTRAATRRHPTGHPGTQAALLVLLLLAWRCRDSATDPITPARLTVSADTVRLWVGDTLRVTAEIAGGDGTPTAITWSSSTQAVEVSPSGLVRAVARGQGYLRVSGGGETVDIPVTSLPVIRGRLHTPVAADLTVLQARWRAAGTADSARVAADGKFTIRASTLESAGELLIDSGDPRQFHPFLYPFSVDSLADVAVVMVPRTWTIQRGMYRGKTVDISLDLAMDEPNIGLSYYSASVGEDGKSLQVDLMTWPTDRFPAAVSFDHRHSSPMITPQDSVAIWGVLNRMEEIFGIDLFRPVPADPQWWPDQDEPGLVPGVIRLGFQEGLIGAAWALSDEPPQVWTQDLGTWAAEGRFSEFNVDHLLVNGGRLLLGGLQTFGRTSWELTLMHEMLHVLGAGHTCRIPSTQGPCMRTQEPSQYDVAYLELLR